MTFTEMLGMLLMLAGVAYTVTVTKNFFWPKQREAKAAASQPTRTSQNDEEEDHTPSSLAEKAADGFLNRGSLMVARSVMAYLLGRACIDASNGVDIYPDKVGKPDRFYSPFKIVLSGRLEIALGAYGGMLVSLIGSQGETSVCYKGEPADCNYWRLIRMCLAVMHTPGTAWYGIPPGMPVTHDHDVDNSAEQAVFDSLVNVVTSYEKAHTATVKAVIDIGGPATIVVGQHYTDVNDALEEHFHAVILNTLSAVARHTN